MQSDVLELLIIYSVKSNQMINSIIFGAISPEVVRKLNQNYATHFHKKTNAFNGLHIFATKRFFFCSAKHFKKRFILLGARKSAFKQNCAKDDFWMLFGFAPLNLGIIFQSI